MRKRVKKPADQTYLGHLVLIGGEVDLEVRIGHSKRPIGKIHDLTGLHNERARRRIVRNRRLQPAHLALPPRLAHGHNDVLLVVVTKSAPCSSTTTARRGIFLIAVVVTANCLLPPRRLFIAFILHDACWSDLGGGPGRLRTLGHRRVNVDRNVIGGRRRQLDRRKQRVSLVPSLAATGPHDGGRARASRRRGTRAARTQQCCER